MSLFCIVGRGSNRASALSFFRRAPGCACSGPMPSSARLHDLKFTFTPAGADDSVHSKAPLPGGGCLRSAQTGRVFKPILFFLFQKEKNGFNLPRKERGLCKTGSANRAAIASEEASSIPFPPGRRKLHIRSLLLPSQIVTVSLGHNLAIWNFTTPHAILMMAGALHFMDTVYRGENRQKKAPSMREPFETR